MKPASPTRLSEEEFLALEARSEAKHELINGVAYDMAGASPAHNLVVSNVVFALRTALGSKGGKCIVLGSDQRLHVPATGMYTYPDVMVVCEKPVLHGPPPQSIVNPTAIVEVLSESTENDDRGPKFAHYRTIGSLQDVLFVSQTEPRVEHYHRLDTGQWLLTEMTGGSVAVPGLGCELAVDLLYENLELLA